MTEVVGRTAVRWAVATWVLIAALVACSGISVSRHYQQAALATGAPLATDVGLDILKTGGNAFDAAVAIGFALAVVHPQAGNIGGGGFAMVRDGATGTVRALDFRETAPQQAHPAMYLDEQGNVMAGLATHGALACGVPGTVAGLHALWSEYGTLPWESLIAPAVKLAREGFVVDEYLARSLAKHRVALSTFDATAAVFFPGGRLLGSGDRLIQTDLAHTLELIAEQEADGFYRGQVAEQIVTCMQQHGGLITAGDLAAYRAIWREPIHFTFDTLHVYSMPPPSSGGIVMGQILGYLERFDLSALAPDSATYLHLFCEAARLAFADRAVHLGDPAFHDIPEYLLDSLYLERRWKLVSEVHATPSAEIPFGPPLPEESPQTTHYSVCDRDGNMVALTYTLNTSYGSKLLVAGAGFLLNNEMDDFAIKPGYPNTYGLVGGEANKIEPGKRMLSSMSPTLVLRPGHGSGLSLRFGDKPQRTATPDQPYLALGAPGGSRIITVVAQAILNLTRFDLDLAEAARQPRFHHQWLPDQIYLERGGFDIRVMQDLIRRGHDIKECDPYSDLQIVMIDDDGLLSAVSDPRGNGRAGGF